MPLYLVERSQVPAISLEEAKDHLRVDHGNTDDDTLIASLVAAATQYCDGRDGCLQRALVAQTWDLKLDSFPCYHSAFARAWLPYDCIRIPLPPLIDVESIKYIDTSGVEQTYAGSYRVAGIGAGQGSYIQLRDGQNWPTVAGNWPEPITVRFRAGYIDDSDSPASGSIPEPILQAIKMIVGHLYANRETVVVGSATAIEVPYAAEWLLAPFKVYA